MTILVIVEVILNYRGIKEKKKKKKVIVTMIIKKRRMRKVK